MNKDVSHRAASQEIYYPRFVAFYTWMTSRPRVRQYEDPLRRETVGQAQGVVLEVGVGGGQNFPFYDAERVVRVEAAEPDEAMLVVARRRLADAPIPSRSRVLRSRTSRFPTRFSTAWWQHSSSVPYVIRSAV